MAIFHETIPDSLKAWILEQKMLWVGTAPLSPDGHINISPKGGQTFGIPNSTTFWFLDLSGSGVETHAHLHEPGNGRICVMFSAFEGPPKIVRLWGKGRALECGSPEYDAFVKEHGVQIKPGARSIILVQVDQVGSSCGFSVPFYEFKGWRRTLDELWERREKAYESGKESESMDAYWAWKSQLSVDGLPGMKRGYEYAQKHGVAPLKKFVGQAAPKVPRRPNAVSTVHLVLAMLLSFVIGVMVALTVIPPDVVRKIQSKELFLQ